MLLGSIDIPSGVEVVMCWFYNIYVYHVLTTKYFVKQTYNFLSIIIIFKYPLLLKKYIV